MDSLRESIELIQRIWGDHTKPMYPAIAQELERTLAALNGNCLDRIREKKAAYQTTYLKFLQEHSKAAQAKIFAEATPEFMALEEAKDLEELRKSLIISIRSYLKTQAEEYRHTH